MACGDFKQIRIGEYLTFRFDSSGEFAQNPLALSDAIDVGAAGKVTVTITFTRTDLHGGDLRFKFATAPVNVEEYYVDVGVNIDLTDDITTVTAVMDSTHDLSRFFRLIPEVTTNPSADASVTCTIDAIVRGCGA